MSIRDEIIATARSWMFQPYIFGGDNALIGLDCSQLAIEVYRKHGLYPRRGDDTAAGLFARYNEWITPFPVMAGLAFWRRPGGGRICHVGIISGIRFDNDGLKDVWIVEASGPGHKCRTLEEAVRFRGYVKERSLGHDRGNELFAYVDPVMKGLERYNR